MFYIRLHTLGLVRGLFRRVHWSRGGFVLYTGYADSIAMHIPASYRGH